MQSTSCYTQTNKLSRPSLWGPSHLFLWVKNKQSHACWITAALLKLNSSLTPELKQEQKASCAFGYMYHFICLNISDYKQTATAEPWKPFTSERPTAPQENREPKHTAWLSMPLTFEGIAIKTPSLKRSWWWINKLNVNIHSRRAKWRPERTWKY